jgi:hypothetical protein
MLSRVAGQLGIPVRLEAELGELNHARQSMEQRFNRFG